MTCVRLYFTIDGERRRADFCYFHGAKDETIIRYYCKERPHLRGIEIEKIITAETWDEILTEDKDG